MAQKDLERAESYQKMYKTKVDNTNQEKKAAKTKGGKKEDSRRQVEDTFLETVLKAVHSTKVLQIHSATYICPGQVDPKTKMKLKDEEVLAKLDGNQTPNLYKACEGKDKCAYVVDPSVIGEAAPGCTDYTYTVKYSCDLGFLAAEAEGESVKVVASKTKAVKKAREQKNAKKDQGKTKPSGSEELVQLSETNVVVVPPSNAQIAAEQVKDRLGVIKEELKQEQGKDKKKAAAVAIDGMPTTDALAFLKKQLSQVTPAPKKGPSDVARPVVPMETAALAPGSGKRTLKLQCVQKQDPRLAAIVKTVRSKQKLVDALKKRLAKDAAKVDDKLEGKVIQDKAKA